MLFLNYVKEFIGHFQHDWHHNRVLFFLEAIGMSLILGGFMGLGVIGKDFPMLLYFGLDCAGASCMLMAGHIRKSGFIVLFQCFFIATAVIGIVNLLINR